MVYQNNLMSDKASLEEKYLIVDFEIQGVKILRKFKKI